MRSLTQNKLACVCSLTHSFTHSINAPRTASYGCTAALTYCLLWMYCRFDLLPPMDLPLTAAYSLFFHTVFLQQTCLADAVLPVAHYNETCRSLCRRQTCRTCSQHGRRKACRLLMPTLWSHRGDSKSIATKTRRCIGHCSLLCLCPSLVPLPISRASAPLSCHCPSLLPLPHSLLPLSCHCPSFATASLS